MSREPAVSERVSGEVLDPDAGPTGAGAVLGLVRVGAELAWHTTGWAVDRSLRGSWRVVRAATSPRDAVALAREAERALLRTADDLLRTARVEQRVRDTGVVDHAAAARSAAARMTPARVRRAADDVQRVSGVRRQPSRERASRDATPRQGPVRVRSEDANGTPDGALRARGEELLRLSRDVRFEADAHPAYERILSELAPDEARILLLLLTNGPQPAVDVRTGGPLGLISSKLIAPGLSMIGSRAGLRYPARVPAYLNNLFRLGLVWFSRETLQDPLRYQVLEAQPDVLEAIHSVRQAKVVRRSIHLTPFGEDFCRTCFPVDEKLLEAAPGHALPPEGNKAASPPVLGGA